MYDPFVAFCVGMLAGIVVGVAGLAILMAFNQIRERGEQ